MEEYLTLIVPSLITIIGFIVTSINNKNIFEQNIQKYKTEHQILDLNGLQKDALECANVLCRLVGNDKEAYSKLKQLQNKVHSTVISFGSEDAVKIMLYIKNLIYIGADDGEAISNRELIAAYVLLSMQLKYDTTGIKTSPNAWYIGSFTSSKMLETGFYDDSVIAINKIVEKLKLNNFLKINP